mmetsp:Transcript_58037/g.111942  ORF Transcript_58037/g.111942 Transcript_58037/m.111942 type:complete len:233 (-) Transcript_58037:194-892(-)
MILFANPSLEATAIFFAPARFIRVAQHSPAVTKLPLVRTGDWHRLQCNPTLAVSAYRPVACVSPLARTIVGVFATGKIFLAVRCFRLWTAWSPRRIGISPTREQVLSASKNIFDPVGIKSSCIWDVTIVADARVVPRAIIQSSQRIWATLSELITVLNNRNAGHICIVSNLALKRSVCDCRILEHLLQQIYALGIVLLGAAVPQGRNGRLAVVAHVIAAPQVVLSHLLVMAR